MRIFLMIVALAGFSTLACAQQADSFPTRPVRLIVATPAGSTPDVGARLIAQRMSDDLKRPVVVENKPGANGLIAVQEVLSSPRDGYTLLVAPSSTMSINPHVYKNADRVLTQFAAVGQLYKTDFSLIARADTGLNSVSDVIARAKKEPGKIVAAYAAVGSASHAALELFAMSTGVSFHSIPFNSSPAAALAVAGGHADILFETIAATEPFVKAGKAKRLAMTGRQRFELAPDVPTLAESGLKDFAFTTWAGLFAPNETPPANVARLSAALQVALKNASLITALSGPGLLPGEPSAKVFEAQWRSESEMWKNTVADSLAKQLGR